MNRTKTFLGLYIILAILVMGVAYAAIANLDFIITGNALTSPSQENFKVKFTGTPTFTGTGTADIRITSDTTAIINVSDIISVGETLTVQLTVSNESYDIAAYLTSTLANNNQSYFEVTQQLATTELAPGGSTTLTINIKLLKATVSTDQTATIGVNITAIPT